VTSGTSCPPGAWRSGTSSSSSLDAAESRARVCSGRHPPVTFVDPSDAPMLLVNSVGEFIPIAQAREMAGGLRRAGVRVRVIEMPGDKHAGEYANDPVPGSSSNVLDVSIAFLRSELQRARES